MPIDSSVWLDGNSFKGGLEWYVFTEIWKNGGKYIIIAKNTNQHTGRVENYAFVYNADYVGSDDIFCGSIIDNQKTYSNVRDRSRWFINSSQMQNDLLPIIWWDHKTDILL